MVINTKIGIVENRISDVCGLVKKRVYNARISQIEGILFTTSDYKTFTSDMLDAKIKKIELITKSDIFNVIKNSNISTKLATLAAKAELKIEQDKIVKLYGFESYCFCGKSQLEDNRSQNYCVFHPVYKHFKNIVKIDHTNFSVPTSKEFSEESIQPSAATNYSLAPVINYTNTKARVKFDKLA